MSKIKNKYCVIFPQSSPVKITGIALLDSIEQTMSLCEITDDEYFSNTEALIVQLAAKECLLIADNSPESTTLKKVVFVFFRSLSIISENLMSFSASHCRSLKEAVSSLRSERNQILVPII